MSKRKANTPPSVNGSGKAPPPKAPDDDDPAPSHMAELRALGPAAVTAAFTIDAICTMHPELREAMGELFLKWLQSARAAGHSAALLDYAVNTVAYPGHAEHAAALDMLGALFFEPAIKDHEIDWGHPVQMMAVGPIYLMTGCSFARGSGSWLDHAAWFICGVAHTHPGRHAVAELLVDLEPFMAAAWGAPAASGVAHA